MKKENRKMAQQRRAEERRKNEFRKKLSKILVIGIPSLAVLALVIVLIVDGVTNNSDGSQTDGTNTEASADTGSSSDTSGSADSASQDTGTSYSTDTSLTVENGDTVNIDYVGSIDGVEFDGGNTQGMGTDLMIGSGSYIDDFEEFLTSCHTEIFLPNSTVKPSLSGTAHSGITITRSADAALPVRRNDGVMADGRGRERPSGRSEEIKATEGRERNTAKAIAISIMTADAAAMIFFIWH